MAKSWPLTTISAPRQPPAMCYLSKCVCASGHPQVPASPKWAISCFVFFLSQQSNQVASLYKRWHFVFFFFKGTLRYHFLFSAFKAKGSTVDSELNQNLPFTSSKNHGDGGKSILHCLYCTMLFFWTSSMFGFFISWYHTLLSPFKQTQPGVCYANTKPFPLSMSNQKSTLKT